MRWRKSLILLLLGGVVLTGCQANLFQKRAKPAPVRFFEPCDPAIAICPVILTPDENTVRPQPRAKSTPTGPGFVEGVAPASLDDTTQAEKLNALDTASSAAEKKLGTTIATLGDVGQQGFWVKTPLVVEEIEGRIVWAADGNSVKVTLLPKQGDGGSGSQISLAAMRALGIPLTTLAELIIFSE
ncbi:MAG: hypothetical protein ACI861_000019 [Paracoccaceae bacterium]|jgi:hypothetical protein